MKKVVFITLSIASREILKSVATFSDVHPMGLKDTCQLISEKYIRSMMTSAESLADWRSSISGLWNTGVGLGLRQCISPSMYKQIRSVTYFEVILSHPAATPTSISPLEIESETDRMAMRPDEHSRLIVWTGVR